MAGRNGSHAKNMEAEDTLEQESLIHSAESHAAYGSSEEVVERHTHCPICGGHLHFIHLTDFALNMTREASKCPECGYKARATQHKLQ